MPSTKTFRVGRLPSLLNKNADVDIFFSILSFIQSEFVIDTEPEL